MRTPIGNNGKRTRQLTTTTYRMRTIDTTDLSSGVMYDMTL